METRREIRSSAWGWLTLGAVGASIVGYVVQSLFDYVPAPGIVGLLSFYVLFLTPAVVALVAGGIAVLTGRKRKDHTARFGFAGLAYAVLAQTVQSTWDVAAGEIDFTVIATYVVVALLAATGVVLLRRAGRTSLSTKRSDASRIT